VVNATPWTLYPRKFSSIHRVRYLNEFDVHGSVHLGNVYVQMKVQLDAHVFVSILYYIIFFLHVSCAICTHPQEQKLHSVFIGMRNGYGM
jgi:hypothetical protein